jgi:hypothetical protein
LFTALREWAKSATYPQDDAREDWGYANIGDPGMQKHLFWYSSCRLLRPSSLLAAMGRPDPLIDIT